MPPPSRSNKQPTVDLRVASKQVKFQFQSYGSLLNWKWIFVLLVGAVLKWTPELAEYIRIAMSLLNP